MDQLEHYLDQICRSIGGPRSMRQHVRQELREHLLDAVAQHKAAGLPEEEALAKALEEFGRPEDVRSELEAAHGQRMLAIVIDRAMQWKEMTMRAKWLWTSWAYLSLVLVIALEALLLTFIVIFIIPKFKKLLHDGMIDAGELEEQGVMWAVNFLFRVSDVGGNYTLFLIVVPALAWALFEWRVRSDNKPFMRLSALGTAAVALAVVVVLTVLSLVIPFTLAMPVMGILARPWAVEQVRGIETALIAAEKALPEKDWEALQDQTGRASNALTRLRHGPALTSLTARDEPLTVEELRAHALAASESVAEMQGAIREHDARQFDKALEDFRTSFGPLRQAAQRPPRPPR